MKRILGFMVLLLIFTSCGQEESILTLDNSAIIDNSKLGMEGEACYPTSACDSGSRCFDDTCQRVIELNRNTVVIVPEEINDFLSINREKRQYVFVKNQRTSKFKVGTILGFPNTKITPNGGVAKITGITDNGDTLTFDVTLPALVEVMGEGSLVIERQLGPDMRFLPEGVDNFGYEKDWSKSVNFPLEFAYPDKINSMIEVKGSVNLAYTLFVKVDTAIAWAMPPIKLKELIFKNTLELKNSFSVDVDVHKSVDLQEIKAFQKFLHRDYGLGNFTKDFHGVTLNFEANIAISLEPKAKLDGTAHMDFTNTDTVVVGFKKDSAGWGVIKDFSMDNQLNTNWNVKGTMNLDLVLKPRIALVLAGDISGFAINGGMDFGANVTMKLIDAEGELSGNYSNDNGEGSGTNKLCYKLDGGLVLGAFAKVNVFSLNKSLGGENLCTKKWSWLKILKEKEYLGACGAGESCNEGLSCKEGLLGIGGKRCYADSFCSDVSGEKECHVFRCDTAEDCRVGSDNQNLTCVDHKCVDANPSNGDYETVSVAGGTFQRGCTMDAEFCKSDQLPLKDVNLDAYKFGKYEVTVEQYKKCVDASQCVAPTSGTYTDGESNKRPVTSVSWSEAASYCAYLGNGWRLPTEAQWEKAAKGTTTQVYPWGDDEYSCDKATMKYFADDSTCTRENASVITEVGTAAGDTSDSGAMDMAGNVEEWVYDSYERDYYTTDQSLDNPEGALGESLRKKVVRGGNYSYRPIESDTINNKFRTFYRMDASSDTRSNLRGFRCVDNN